VSTELGGRFVGSIGAMTVGDLLAALDDRYPFADAGDWDPVGLQVGGMSRSAERVGVCHEVTSSVIEAAFENEVDCLVSYHPLMFVPTTSLTDETAAESLALRVVENRISLIVVHTALDVASPGTADAMLAELGLNAAGTFAPVDDVGGGHIGRIGRLDAPIAFDQFAATVADVVGSTVRTSSAHPELVETVGIVPGSGGRFAVAAAGLVDVYVSGDVGHHDAKESVTKGIGLIDAGHVPTERPGVRALYAAVCEASPTAIMVGDDPHPWEG
jgi:dinuclear metal center YbgI/SA1388 family protein